MNKIVLSALVGAAVGLLLAEFFPNLGKGSFASNMNDLAFSLGKQKPYMNFAGVGAVAGAIVGFLSAKK